MNKPSDLARRYQSGQRSLWGQLANLKLKKQTRNWKFCSTSSSASLWSTNGPLTSIVANTNTQLNANRAYLQQKKKKRTKETVKIINDKEPHTRCQFSSISLLSLSFQFSWQVKHTIKRRRKICPNTQSCQENNKDSGVVGIFELYHLVELFVVKFLVTNYMLLADGMCYPRTNAKGRHSNIFL